MDKSEVQREPRWPILIALVAVGLLNDALPSTLVMGPKRLVTSLVVLLLVPALIANQRGKHEAAKLLSLIALVLVTISMAGSLWLLVSGLANKIQTPPQLLLSAALLWVSNVLVFASWYWKLDAGGPLARERQASHQDGAFLFPQMTLAPDVREKMGEQDWRPGFVDYLFLAFNTSTAFSPTDAPVLSAWAKALMMVQASISLLTLALLAARAINIL
jgi:hypothetical protein